MSAATAQHVLEDAAAVVADVDSTDLATREAQFSLFIEMERAGAFTPTSFEVPDGMAFETAEAVANFLGQIKRRSSWYIGDLLNECETRFSDLYAQVAHATGLSEQTLLNLTYVSKHVPKEMRRASLAHSVHARVAALGKRDQRRWLDKAEQHGWTRAELDEHMKAKRKDEKPELPLDPNSHEEVLRAILRDMKVLPDDPQHVLVPNETIERVKASLGVDEDGTDTDA